MRDRSICQQAAAVLKPVFERFAEKSPVSLMVQATIERAWNASELDQLFQRHSQYQYTRTLYFSSVVDLLTQAVCGVRSSVHAAYQATEEPVGVSLTSVYNKLNGVEPEVAAQLVRHSASQLAPVIDQLGGALPPWLPGYETRVLDGNHFSATEHRLQETRGDSAGPLPAMALAVLDPARRLIVDLFPCEDAHTQERALLGDVLERVADRQLWVADRNFCVRSFLAGLVKRGASFVIRLHANLAWKSAGKVCGRGKIAEGRLREQAVTILDDEGKPVPLRRVILELDEAQEIGTTRRGMLIAIPDEEWSWFLTLSTDEFVAVLRELAKKVRMAAFKKKRRGPKKPATKRTYNPGKPHVSTKQILEKRKTKRN